MPEAPSRPQTPGRLPRLPTAPQLDVDDGRIARDLPREDRMDLWSPPISPPLSPPAASSLRELPPDLVAEALSHLDAGDLPSAELSCKALSALVRQREAWRAAYQQQCKRHEDWRMPQGSPRSWKRFFYQSKRERGLIVQSKISGSAAGCLWRVALPLTADPIRRRSREFSYATDALGQPIKWQIELELCAGVPLPPDAAHTPGMPAQVELLGADGVPRPHRQTGLVRMWTTNQWTAEATRHYYGSHCTMSVRDTLNEVDLVTQTMVDIDNSHALEFDAAVLPASREVVVRVDFTLALEVMAPLSPFYELIAAPPSPGITAETDLVKVGYCKAVFEIARCKRKFGGTFARQRDREIRGLVALAADEGTSETLRVEVFQALFNLLGPTSVLLDDALVTELLGVCWRWLRAAPLSGPSISETQQRASALLAQNTLGAVFNLLVHPLTMQAAAPADLAGIVALLSEEVYSVCHFSIITILLTVHSWGALPAHMLQPLEFATIGFMARNDPLDSDCTGVAWDESDVAAFFMPLLRTGHLICVRFAAWCVAKYYFPQCLLETSSYALLGTTA
eukprot:TRINITY_DN8096_c0_g1_i1.p1 TRINITY_DN8096_c0_g1~~TRINITY_DN8096_c0_g1_i1.p1  ORF type:complete len:567 (+),score=136.09 TRINITY_DN8096_c0_g1_i1:172-1872(+)